LAIGAQPRDVLARFLSRGLRGAALGGLVGMALALLGAHLLGAWLVGVRPLDAIAFVGAGIVVSAAATAACYASARRAARGDPVIAQRGE
jgi:putative ABC transport system permease protein